VTEKLDDCHIFLNNFTVTKRVKELKKYCYYNTSNIKYFFQIWRM